MLEGDPNPRSAEHRPAVKTVSLKDPSLEAELPAASAAGDSAPANSTHRNRCFFFVSFFLLLLLRARRLTRVCLCAERQDSTKGKAVVCQRMSGPDDGPAQLPSSPKGSAAAASVAAAAAVAELEPAEPVVAAESFDKLMEHKTVKKQCDKLAKKLDELQKEHDKERVKIEEELGLVAKTKTSTKLIKRISSKSL